MSDIYNPSLFIVDQSGTVVGAQPTLNFIPGAGASISAVNNTVDHRIDVTISATGTGTVTSVNVSGGTTGLTFSGGPITTSGTITMTGTLSPANVGAAGSNTQVQWNNSGVLGASSNFTWNNSTKVLALGTGGSLDVGAGAIYGSITAQGGNNFSGLPAYGIASIGTISVSYGWQGNGFMFTNYNTGSTFFSMVMNADTCFYGFLNGSSVLCIPMVQNSTGVTGFGATPYNAINATVHATSVAAATKGMIVQGAASQSANLHEWQNSSSGILSSVDAAGILTLGLAGTQTGTLKFKGTTSGTVTVLPAAAAGTWTFTLPITGGTNTYALTTNGSGTSTWSQINLTSALTGILPSANGGTANGFTKFSGPASSEKTFTLPNANDTIAALATAGVYTAQQNFGAVAITSTSNSIAWNLATAQSAKHTATENTTLANPSNMVDGGTYTFRWTQHASSAKTLAFGTAYKWSNNVVPVVSPTVNSVELFTFVSDGTNMYGYWRNSDQSSGSSVILGPATVDMTSTTAFLIGTTATNGLRFVPLEIILLCTAASSPTGVGSATLGVGQTGGGYTDWMFTFLDATFDALNECYRYSLPASATANLSAPETTGIYAKMGTAIASGTMSMRVYVRGIYS